MTVDASLEAAQQAGGSRPGRDATALDTEAAADLGHEFVLLTRALFTQLLSDAARRARASAPSDRGLPAPSPSWDELAPPIDVSQGAGTPSAEEPAAAGHLELPSLDSLELDVPSLAWEDPPAPAVPAAVTPSDFDLPVIDVPTLEDDRFAPPGDASHEDGDVAPDEQHLDEDEPEVLMPHLAHVRDLRVLEEIRFLED